MRTLVRSLLLAGAALHLSVVPMAVTIPAAYAQQSLPAPYVSRAFDAVLMPIDQSVRAAFDFDASVEGVLVLAVEPGGVADQQGIEPGDIISQINEKAVTSPLELDEIVYYWLLQDIFDFSFGYYRDGTLSTSDVYITLDEYYALADIASVSSWSAWSYEGFSYEEYTLEYSEEIVDSYEESETIIEESVESEEFSEEMTDDDYSEDDASEDDVGEDDSGDDSAEDDGSDDGMDEGGDDGFDDDGGGEEE